MITLDLIRSELEKKHQVDQVLQFVEVTADTLEEALSDAAVQLQTKAALLEYEVIEKGSEGFLGLAKSPWTIRAYESELAASARLKKKAKSEDVQGIRAEEQVAVLEQDGEFFIRYYSGEIMLKVLRPVGKGRAVNYKDVLSAVRKGEGYEVNEEAIKKIVPVGSEEYKPIGTFMHNPAYDAVFSTEVSQDEMTVSILASQPSPGGSEITADQINRSLDMQGVVAGVDQERIQNFVDRPIYGVYTVVAQGLQPIDGRDAYMAYNFETDNSKLRIKESSSGQIDFKELNLIQNVVEGQPLAQKMLPERGKAGKTVMGRYLDAKNGKDINLPIGKNVSVDIDGRTILATTAGQVLLVGNKINVEPIMQVDGDVSIKTGNITFFGTVIVKGNVDDGFNIKASGNIEVYGTVGKCILEADGDIIVSLGVMGRDEGIIRTGKSLWAKFIQNTTVDVEENIIVADGIINSKVTANKKIIVQGKRATIMGGHLFATEEINAKNIGSSGGGSETVLEVGFNPKSKQRLDSLFDTQAALVRELDEVSLNLTTLENQKKVRKMLSPDKEESLNMLQRRRGEIMEEAETCSKEIQAIQAYLRELKVIGKVSASGTVYAGVKIYIRDVKEEIRNEVKSVSFLLENGLIRYGKYEAPSNDIRKVPDGYATN